MVENLQTTSHLDDNLEKKRIAERLRITRAEAQQLALENPQIGDDYRAGLSLTQIVEIYDIEFERYPNSTKSLVVEIIKVLIPDEAERKRIAHEHFVARGKRLRDRKEGIFSRTGQERSDFEREKAARIDPAVRHERAVKMGRGSTKAKGLYCWDELKDPETDLNEEETVLWLTVAFKKKNGKVDYPGLHGELERRFLQERGYDRRIGSVRMKVLRMAKQLGIEF